MGWKKLVDEESLTLQRGWLLKFTASHSSDAEVIMMVCGHPDHGNRLIPSALISITGYNAGINPYVEFPLEAYSPGPGISKTWLIDNWCKWVCPQGDPREALVRAEINANDI
jgi:hypothetical protein